MYPRLLRQWGGYRGKHGDAILKVLNPVRLPDMTWPAFAPLLFLSISNVFMTFAWYGQLRFPDRPLWIVVLASWGIAFLEYCFVVPANRIGHTVYSAAQIEDDAGDHHADRVRRVLGDIFERS